ncbi:MAG: GDP-mannose 4,6-dehydratase, partial [Chitinophagaceae bacterium]|nr:GDP-mannose 4,6-dehydratase [Chitinophagaceae bacterium]
MRALITGTAGFIGFHAVNRFLADGWEVVGFDSINDYYDVNLKYGRLAAAGIKQDVVQWNEPCQSTLHAGYTFYRLCLEDKTGLKALFDRYPPFDVVVNLAAQAGVRYSLSNPGVYAESNIMGFLNLLECCRHHKAKHLVYASSSSVYGLNKAIPFHENQATNHPISL